MNKSIVWMMLLCLLTMPARVEAKDLPVVNVGVHIEDPEVKENLADSLATIATDAATAISGHVSKLVDFVTWNTMSAPVLGKADALLKVSILQRTNPETYIQFTIVDKTSEVVLPKTEIVLWAANDFTRPTDDEEALKKNIRDVLERYFTTEASSNKFRDVLLENIPVAEGVTKEPKTSTSTRTYFVIGIPYDSLMPGPNLIFSINVEVPDGNVTVPAKVFLAPSGKSKGMTVATPIHYCKKHPVIIRKLDLPASQAECSTSTFSAEVPAVLSLMTDEVLKKAKVRIAHYDRDRFGL